MLKYITLFITLSLIQSSFSNESYYVPIDNWYTPASSPGGFLGPQWEWAIKYGLNQSMLIPGVLDDIDVELEFFDTENSQAVGLGLLIQHLEGGVTFTGGNGLSGVSSATGQAAAVYGIAQLSGSANTAILSDKTKYPFFSRNYAPSNILAASTAFTIEDFFQEYGRGWDKVALLSTTDGYGISISQSFISSVDQRSITIASYQQFLNDQTDFTVEFQEITRSGARVIVLYATANQNTFETLFMVARENGLIGDGYVWFTGPGVPGTNFFTTAEGTINTTTTENMRGLIGSLVYFPREGLNYQILEEEWVSDPAVVGGAGPGTTVGVFTALYYDHGYLIGLVINEAKKQGLIDDNDPSTPTAEQWSNIIRNQTFIGATGRVIINELGDREMDVAIVNFIPETATWEEIGVWNVTSTDTVFFTDIIWQDNTTNVPDLDIRPAFDYWSCSNREERTDETGKEIDIQTPDGSDVDDIDIDYHCDYFIDCKNLSDESVGCSTNYLALFIVFGIITGFLILFACLLIPFVIIFGCIVPRKRVRASSPIFLMVIILSCILGYISTFAWYGKPHPVACGFQPWLLGLAVVSMISALCAKTWRIWRIFNKRFNRTVISDKQLVAFYVIMVIPAILILIVWTIVSTPTAEMVDRNGDEHFVCTTGGFTGTPGGLVFFFILVGYEAVVLLFGAFLSIVTRKVPMFFNESKLIAVSIYNLGFLAIVVIPVFLILTEFNPFAAWIIRTCAILYAFTVTLWVQFIPKLIGVICIDKFGDATLNPKSLRGNTGTQSTSASVQG